MPVQRWPLSLAAAASVDLGRERNASTDLITDDVLYVSVDVVQSTQEFYLVNTVQIIERLLRDGVRIASIVGDWFSTQFQALSPLSATDIQNSEELFQASSFLRQIVYIYCSCHLLNLARHDARTRFAFLENGSSFVRSLATQFRKTRKPQAIGRQCPMYCPTRSCHEYLLCRF
jgi:hypothetical protein